MRVVYRYSVVGELLLLHDFSVLFKDTLTHDQEEPGSERPTLRFMDNCSTNWNTATKIFSPDSLASKILNVFNTLIGL